MANSEHLGFVPPQAVEIEEGVLGAVLIDTSCVPVVMGLITENAFYKEWHRVIFHACRTMYDEGVEVDMLTVTERLRRDGTLDNAGGAYFVTTLSMRVASGAHVEEYCRILVEKQMKREIIAGTNEAVKLAYEDTTDAFDCLGVLESAVHTIHELIATGGKMRSLSVIMADVEKDAKKREQLFRSGRCTGIRTGLQLLDRRTSGWQNGDLIILAGRPSMGKTALMLHHAKNAGVPVCVYSLEMSDVSLANRLTLAESNLDAGRFRAGVFTPEEWQEFYAAKSRLEKLPVYIDDNSTVTTRYIKSHSKLMHDRGMCDMIFIDYLQLADMRSDQRGRNREQEVSQATRELKIIAKELNVPVMLLSQLSRACEARADRKPILSDLRESGAIEQDADVVIFAYRPDYYGLTDAAGESLKGIGYELLAKGRNIGIEDIPFRHNASMTKIFDYDPEAENAEKSTNDFPF